MRGSWSLNGFTSVVSNSYQISLYFIRDCLWIYFLYVLNPEQSWTQQVIHKITHWEYINKKSVFQSPMHKRFPLSFFGQTGSRFRSGCRTINRLPSDQVFNFNILPPPSCHRVIHIGSIMHSSVIQPLLEIKESENSLFSWICQI